MGTLLHDIRFGFRMLIARPGMTLVALIALGLGIGANSAVFSIINAILLKPLPLDDLERIVVLWEKMPGQGVDRNEAAMANYLDWRAQNSSFENLAIYTWWSANLTGIEPPERVRGFRVSAGFLETVGISPVIGRGFRPEEDQPGRDAVVVLTHGLWQRRFGSDPKIIGQTVTINGVTRTVIGVMPKDVVFPRGAELLAPLAMTPEVMVNRGSHGNLVVGRLKPGVTVVQAQQDLDAIAGRLERQYPATNTGRGVGVYPILEDTVREYKAASWAMMGAVGFVLLIACANVANLLLARAAGRTREIAVRLALGAGRWRIIRQLLTESVMLGVTGGVAGVLMAMWGLAAFRRLLPDDAQLMMPGFNQLGINERVLSFTLAISILTGIIFGLAPAWQASSPDLNATLKEGGGKSSSGPGRQGLRGMLVMAEISLALVLLIGAGLLMKHFMTILRSSPGFRPDNVLTMTMTLPATKYRDRTQRRNFYEELIERVQSVPGIESAALVNYLPLGGSNSSSSFLVEGLPEPPPGQEWVGRYRVCSPDYFSTMGIALIKGRSFTRADTTESPRVIIVNETLSAKFWPKGDAIGKRLRFTGPPADNPWMEVVGIVSDVRHEMNLPVTPDYYLPLAQDPWSTMSLVARTTTDPLTMAGPVRAAVQAIDHDQPVFDVRSMVQVRDRSILHYRASGVMMSVFGIFALILAATGIYGVMAYAVSQRTHEIGIRMALGAERRDVLKLVIGQGLRLTLIGLGIGLVASWGLMRLMGSLLFGAGVSAADWMIFISLALLLAVVALLACWIPARRAMRVDPMVALRYE